MLGESEGNYAQEKAKEGYFPFISFVLNLLTVIVTILCGLKTY